MPTIKSYSSVTISDQSDVGSLQSYLSCNQPTSIIYNPNNNTYTPDWSSSHLVITPVITFNGRVLALEGSATETAATGTTTFANGLTISYKRRDGSSTPTNIITGETTANGILTVSQNKLADSPSKIITYICSISYLDSSTGITVSTQNTLTFTRVSSATEIKYAYITGENAFLHNSDRTTITPQTITLMADTSSNITGKKWQYQTTSGTYSDYPTSSRNASITGDTLIVHPEDNIWLSGGNRAVIKLVSTNDSNVYDLHQILHIYDGASGDDNISVVLSNQSHYVPCGSNGQVLSWNGASTRIYVYEGGTDETSSWTITATIDQASGITGTFTNNEFIPASNSVMNTDVGYVDFVCTKGTESLSARYTITKSRSGADGKSAVIYELSPDTYVMNLSEDGVTYSPTSVTFYAFTKVGDAVAKQDYSGYFQISTSTDGTTYTDQGSVSSGTSKVWQPSVSDIDVKSVKCCLYADVNKTTLLDEQTVVITRDGISGLNGESGLSVGLVNNQDIIPCNEAGYAYGERYLNIPFYGYMGIERIPIKASISTPLPSGVSLVSNSDATTQADGLIVLHVADNATFGNPETITGSLTVRLTIPNSDMNYIFVDENNNILTDNNYQLYEQAYVDVTYTWNKNLKGVDGENANILQIYSENGGMIRNSKGDTTLKIRYINGAQEVTPDIIQWYKMSGGVYVPIADETSVSILIRADDVNDLEFFKAEATYAGITCEAFYVVDDLSDPIMAQICSTVLEFKNGEGFGAIYTRLYQGTEEIDPLKSMVFSTDAPTNPSDGDYYYALNKIEGNNGTCTLKQYNESQSSWANVNEDYKYTYKYYMIDKNGQQATTVPQPIVARCIYIDPSILQDDYMQFVCEVE